MMMTTKPTYTLLS